MKANDSLNFSNIIQEKLIIPIQKKFSSLQTANKDLQDKFEDLLKLNKNLKIWLIIISVCCIINLILLLILLQNI